MVGGICPAYDRFPFVEIVPYPMGKRHNASRFAYSDTDKLALLIRLLSELVNLYATYNIRQRRYDNRLRLLWLGLCLPLRLRFWRCL